MNNIDIKNIYWMLAYAFRNIKETSIKKISSEKFENIYELLSVMMTQELNKQIKRGLTKEYINKEENLNTIKGKILINETLKTNSLIKNKIICEYDEYSTNSYLNRIIKTACNYLLMSNKIKDRNKVKKLKQAIVYLNNIDLINKNNINWSSIKYNKNNASYRILTNISYLIINGLLINEENGKIKFKNYIDDQQIHRLYEKFILEYYKYHHKELNPSVPQIPWNVEENEFIDLLPKMQTDIVLKYKNKMLIIDAKFWSNIYQNNPLYDKKTFQSKNIYQIFTYVKNADIDKNITVSGLLLYAKTTEDDLIDAKYKISGNTIEITNIDLSKDFNLIKEKLEEIAINLKNS